MGNIVNHIKSKVVSLIREIVYLIKRIIKA